MMTDCVHHTPGRVRAVWPQLKNNPNLAEAAEAALCRIDGVVSVKASTFTGTLFIRYDADCTHLDVLLESMREVRLAYGSAPAPRRAVRKPAPPIPQARDNRLGGMLFGMLVEKCIERSALALVAAVL